MAKLPTHNRIFRAIWTADSYVSTALFETWDLTKRVASAYSSFLHKWFGVKGLWRMFFGGLTSAFSLGTLFAFALLAFALPPFTGEGDIWNRGRDYAVTFTNAEGDIIGRRGILQDDAIELKDLPPQLIKAVLATEDARFFEHFGVDVIGTLRAIVRNARADGVKQGGSSITQQVAKNLFLSPERTIQRKVHEAFFALWLEARLNKQQILKLYLDRSYLGGGTYGVEAASQFYFGKSARDISLSEAAILAGLFKAPSQYAPHQNLEAARARANVVLYRMLDSGFISQGELLQARRNPAQVVPSRNPESPDWFLDYAFRDTMDVLEKNGLTKEFVIEVKTTIDVNLQRESQRIINDTIDTLGVDGHFTQGASVTMAPDGAVKAIVGGRDYEVSLFNRVFMAKRQSGSSFKPFVYLAALIDGHDKNEVISDGPVSVGGWSPGNYKDKYYGPMSLTLALAKSANSIPVKLMQAMGGRAGRDKIIATAHAAGVQGELETWPPMVLGTSALTLLDLATGYATFAADGKQAHPYAVVEIKRANGDLIYERSKKVRPPEQTLPADKVEELNSMLEQVVKIGTARSADLEVIPQAGKTGTNQGYKDAWFVGYTAHNVTGVWVGNDDNTPMNEITGGKIPAPTWKRIMEVAEAGLQPEGLPGIPFDEKYVAATEARAKKLAEEGVKAADSQVVAEAAIPSEIPPADGSVQDPNATVVNASVPEADAAATVEEAPAATPDQPSADNSNDVLKGMFALFEQKKARKAAAASGSKTRTSRKQRASQYGGTIYDVPGSGADTGQDATQNRSFLDRLFGPNPNKKRKKKPFFNLNF